MKKILIFGMLLLLLVFGWGYSQYTTGDGDRAVISSITGNTVVNFDDKIIIEKEKSEFEFEGFAVGKSHIGRFDEWDGYLIMDGDKIIGLEGVIQASSVSTGIEKLNTHLKSADFFEVEKYPDIKFSSGNIDSKNKIMTGQLSFRGVTKEISFPVELSDEGVSAEFYLDTTPFSFKYTGVNKEVRIKFNFVR